MKDLKIKSVIPARVLLQSTVCKRPVIGRDRIEVITLLIPTALVSFVREHAAAVAVFQNDILIDFQNDSSLGSRLCSLEKAQITQRIGMTQANLSILKTGKAKAVRMSTMNEICRILECQPGDLFEYVKEES